MKKPKFKILRYGPIVRQRAVNRRLELNLVEVPGYAPRWELAEWDPAHENRGPGIYLTDTEMVLLKESIGKALDQTKDLEDKPKEMTENKKFMRDYDQQRSAGTIEETIDRTLDL